MVTTQDQAWALNLGPGEACVPRRQAGWAGTTAHPAVTCCNTSMSGEIEQRLAAAAQAAREYDLCGQEHAQLSAREGAAAADLDAAQQQYAGEEKDVERLEHLSLTRVLAAFALPWFTGGAGKASRTCYAGWPIRSGAFTISRLSRQKRS